MDAKPLAQNGLLKNFTFRDMFYAVGLIATVICTATINYTLFQSRLAQNERDIAKEAVHVQALFDKMELRLDAVMDRITKMDHEGTTASKNGIYTESNICKDNARRIELMQAKWEDMSVKIANIDANVKTLMGKRD